MKAYRVKRGLSPKKNDIYESRAREIHFLRLDHALRASHISSKDVVLDIGTSRGFFTLSLILHANRVYACDLDTQVDGRYFQEWAKGKTLLYHAREIVRQELGEDALERLLLFYADGASLPLKDNSFDAVFLLDCLEHVFSPTNETIIYEVWRVLRKDGVFISTVPNEKGIALLLRTVLGKLTGVPRSPYPWPELVKAAIYNQPIGIHTGGHEGYDFLRDVRIIERLFDNVSVKHIPFPLFGRLNPTVLVKADKKNQ